VTFTPWKGQVTTYDKTLISYVVTGLLQTPPTGRSSQMTLEMSLNATYHISSI